MNNNIFGKAIPQLIHDIRNSLNIIIGFSSLLQLDENINDETRNYLKKIFFSGMNIEQLLSNVDYYLQDKIDLEYSNFCVIKNVKDFFKSKTEILNEKQIKINYLNSEESLIIKFTSEIINKIFENLFYFSLKGFKNSKEKIINIYFKKNNNNLTIYYADSTEIAKIDNNFFSYDDVLSIKRGLGPIFIKKYIDYYKGKIYYLQTNIFTNLENIKINNCNGGFIIELPVYT